MEILSTVFSLLGVVIGGALGYYTTSRSEKDRNEREEKAIAYALKAEISSLRLVVEKRQYIKVFSDAYKNMTYTSEPLHIDIRVENDYFQVYKANLNNIGLLPPAVADKVCRFYTLAHAIVEDLKKLQQAKHECAAYYMEFYVEIIEFLNLAMSIANEVEEEIGSTYR